MAKKTNLSDVSGSGFAEVKVVRIGIVTAAWNPDVTGAMTKAARQHLIDNGVLPENIMMKEVPGSYELPLGAQFMLEQEDVDGVVCIGCIIQGETRHFDFIATAVANGIMTVNLNFNSPVSFGVLTTDNDEQARERSGGKHGNKGIEAADAVLSMLKFKVSLDLI